MSGRECKTCDCAQNSPSQQMSGEVETCFEFFMASKIDALEDSKTTMWQAFLWSASVWTTIKTQRDKISSWSARMVANVIGVKKPPWMEMDQWWRHWHRTGHRWIETCNMNVVSAIRERALSWAGHVARMDSKEICAEALRCRGLQWRRWRQLHWKEVEKDKWSGAHPQCFKIYRWEDMVATEVSKTTGKRRRFAGISPEQHGMAASCSKPCELETI